MADNIVRLVFMTAMLVETVHLLRDERESSEVWRQMWSVAVERVRELERELDMARRRVESLRSELRVLVGVDTETNAARRRVA